MNNMMHDISYMFGFTETARNYQYTNFGKGGEDKDFIMAEGRDGGVNNANFLPNPDGSSGIMQMYLWTPKYYSGIKVNAPSNFTNFSTNTQFAVDLNLTPTGVTGDLVIAEPIDGCSPITNGSNISGKIVLIERGNCIFSEKISNAINAGALATLFYNSSTSQEISAYSSGAPIEHHSALISKEAGEQLKTKISEDVVNITMSKDYSTVALPDGSLDNGIIAHEYAHGISNRLTGAGDGSCFIAAISNEQMGEGWSDYIALMLTLKPTDNATIPRSIGTYAQNEETTGAGIRLAKYSPDFTINNYTYGKTNGMEVPASFFGEPVGTSPDVHSIGFVWATMLWDLTWKYVEKYGYNHDVTSDPNSGTARALQTVMNGMKLQPCNPTFVQGRDAILAADQAQTGGENKCLIWKSFAKRGLGVNANSGGINGNWMNTNGDPNPDMYDQVEDYTIPTECETLASNEVKSNAEINIYPNPAKDLLNIKTKDNLGSLKVKIYNMVGSLVLDTNYDPSSDNSINISKLTNGVYVVKIEGIGINKSQKIIIKK